MKWHDGWEDQFKFHDFFALVPHSCGAKGCNTRFWLEKGRRRRVYVPFYPGLPPSEFRCNRCGSMGVPGL